MPLVADDSDVVIGLRGGDHILFSDWSFKREGWATARTEIQCGVWRGVMLVWFYDEEHVTFASEIRRLYKTLTGAAKLCPIDSILEIALTGDGRGGVTVHGYASADGQYDTRLTFTFEIDQTFLPVIADSLEAHRRQ